MVHKHKHLIVFALGLPVYEAGTAAAEDLVGKNVTVILTREKGDGQYKAKNVVVDYLASDTNAGRPAVPPGAVDSVKAPGADDDLPF